MRSNELYLLFTNIDLFNYINLGNKVKSELNKVLGV